MTVSWQIIGPTAETENQWEEINSLESLLVRVTWVRRKYTKKMPLYFQLTKAMSLRMVQCERAVFKWYIKPVTNLCSQCGCKWGLPIINPPKGALWFRITKKWDVNIEVFVFPIACTGDSFTTLFALWSTLVTYLFIPRGMIPLNGTIKVKKQIIRFML